LLVYSNSCSFGYTNGPKAYPELIAKHLGARIINNGMHGSCNRRIIRTSLRDLLELRQTTDDHILALIGLTMLSRTEKWQPWLNQNHSDGDFASIRIDSSRFNWTNGLNTEHKDVWKYADKNLRNYYKEWLLLYDPEERVVELLADIVMFVKWAHANNIDCLVFNNMECLPIMDHAPFLNTFTSTLENCNNVIDLSKFSFKNYALSLGHIPYDFETYGNDGHPNQQAHVDFAEHLIVKYINV